VYVGLNIKQDFIEINEDHGFYNNNIREGRDNNNNNNNNNNFLFLILYYPDCLMR
jgi:hypothetical protein